MLKEYDPSEYLDDNETAAEYLNLALADHDPDFMLLAVNDVARARVSGMKRGDEYTRRVCKPDEPGFFEFVSAIKRLGFKLKVEPCEKEEDMARRCARRKARRMAASRFAARRRARR